MKTRIGISLSSAELRAVLVRGERIVWRGYTPIGSGEDISATLARVFSGAPIRRFPTPRVGVALGLAFSQMKPIDGLPTVKQPGVLNRIVRENAESFFLRGGSRLEVSDVERRPDGQVWAAAFDGGVVDSVLGALRQRPFADVTVLPFVVAVAPLLPAGEHRLVEDSLGVDIAIQTDRHRVQSIRRIQAASGAPTTRWSAPIASGAEDYAAAYGAAIAPAKTPCSWRPPPDPRRTRRIERIQMLVAAAAFVAATGGALVAPGLRAARVATGASAQLADARTSQIDAARVDAELRRVSAQIDRAEQFRASRGGVTMLLGALSQALPDSTALVSLRIDTVEGSFVALATHAADILPEMVSLDPIVAARIVGSVTRETRGLARVERATIRFRRARATAVAKPNSAAAPHKEAR